MTTEDRGTPTSPYGSWPTPITSARIVASAARLGEVHIAADGAIWWSESRPTDGGRSVLVRRDLDGGGIADRLPAGSNARTRVHEYGGAAWWLSEEHVYFAEFTDQRLNRLAHDDATVEPVTAAAGVASGLRYADGSTAADGTTTCVRERHEPDGAVHNEVVSIAPAGSAEQTEVRVLVSGPDFVANPRRSADGAALAWLQWDHPNMPWDGTELRVRTGEGEVLVAGGPAESVLEPTWAADGDLFFLSDRTGWWSLYRWSPGTGETTAVLELDAEIGSPPWQFGTSRYVELPDGRIVAAVCRDGFDQLVVVSPEGSSRALDLRTRCSGPCARTPTSARRWSVSPRDRPPSRPSWRSTSTPPR